MVLHEYYFGNLKKAGGGDPKRGSAFIKATEDSFGSYDIWKTDFVGIGKMRGVGWAICYQDPLSAVYPTIGSPCMRLVTLPATPSFSDGRMGTRVYFRLQTGGTAKIQKHSFPISIGVLLKSARKHLRRSPNVPVQFDGKDDTRQKDFICRFVWVLFLVYAAGCAVHTASAPPRSAPQEARTPNVKPLDPNQAARLQRIMVPLLRAGDQTRSLKQIRLGCGGRSEYQRRQCGWWGVLRQRGCFRRQMTGSWRGILAHEIAHDDLGHVAKAQVLGTGLNLGIIYSSKSFPAAAPSPRSRARSSHALTADQKSWKPISTL